MWQSILIFLLFAVCCNCSKLPSSFKTCNRKQSDFNQCLTKAVENAVRQLNKPIKEVGLANLEPLEVPALTIGAGTGAVGFEQKYKNVKCYGFSKPDLSKFEMNFEKKTIVMEVTFPEIRMDFDYEFNGKILLLPIYGVGPGTYTLINTKCVFTYSLAEYDTKGNKHFKIIGHTLKLEPELIKFHLDNLFDGDKALGDNILKVLNDNWKEVFADVQASYEDAFGQIFSGMFNNLLAKVPISELFGEE